MKQGEALVELETDKVNVEVTAEQSGVLQKIVKQEGDTVAVGEVLGMIGEGNARTSSIGRQWTKGSYRPVTSGLVSQANGQRTPTGPLPPVQ